MVAEKLKTGKKKRINNQMKLMRIKSLMIEPKKMTNESAGTNLLLQSLWFGNLMYYPL